ncbi:InlB B-repeat-containing protein [Clostridium sp.]|uniref:InlB B-repeat-containing protein n=1 Tax=Clostridium sp. TaxID=1506 RepID=UPI002609F693|nr:InlB B-repeat-containing protein [Clostridium sp.]
MKCKFINKIITGIFVLTTLCILIPVKASAEWANDYQGNWYYMQDNEKMTGWKRIDGQLYYFDENGKMQTGWIKAGDSWYFLQNNGALQSGWINYNRNWYYADSSGVMQTGVIEVSGKIYILDDNGIMKNSNAVIDGEFYTIDLDGEVVGSRVPTPSKEFDDFGKCIQVLKNTDNTIVSPTISKFNEVIEDQSESNDDPNEGRTFKVEYKDTNGGDIKTKTVKYGRTIDLYEPTKDGYTFSSWNTKSDGSGTSYDSGDSIKIKGDIILYAQWSKDTYVNGITITGNSSVAVNQTIQMTAIISPSTATDKTVTWSVTNGTGTATINSSGVLTGVSSGTVIVKATAADGSGVCGTANVTVS